MMTKIEKLIDLTILALEQYTNPPVVTVGGQTDLDRLAAAESKAKDALAASFAVPADALKKERKARAPKEKPAEAPNNDIEDQLGLGGDENPKQKEAPAMTEAESSKRADEVTRQFVALTKNDQPVDGKTRAIEMLQKDARFGAARVGLLSHEKRLLWIAELEKQIAEHK